MICDNKIFTYFDPGFDTAQPLQYNLRGFGNHPPGPRWFWRSLKYGYRPLRKDPVGQLRFQAAELMTGQLNRTFLNADFSFGHWYKFFQT